MKPRYRLMRLSQCPNGTRFYFYRLKQLLPFTLIANSFKKHENTERLFINLCGLR